MNSRYGQQLARLLHMPGSDPAFYLLSIHAFVEMVLNTELSIRYGDENGPRYSFEDKLFLYRQTLQARHGQGPGDALRIDRGLSRGLYHLQQLGRSYGLSEASFHNFEPVTLEEAKAGTWNFLEFCRVSGIKSPMLQTLRDNLDVWEHRHTRVEEINELRKIRFKLQLKDLEISDLKGELRRMADEVRRKPAGMQPEPPVPAAPEAPFSENPAAGEAGEAGAAGPAGESASVSGSRGAALEYLRDFMRLSSYTRTRRDFEQSIVRLSGEQKLTLDKIRDEDGVLIRGPAGSGKTVVLLESLRMSLEQQPLFDAGQEASHLLLTYANTLVKYDRYISRLLGIGGERLAIQTADSLVSSRLHGLMPYADISYDRLLENAIEEYGRTRVIPGWMSIAELAFEIDQFIWGWNLSREEYVEQMIPRQGLSGRLDRNRRLELFELQEDLSRELTSQQLFTRNLALCYLLEHEGAAAAEAPLPAPAYEALFIDEVQDLPPVMLRYFRLLGRRLIMAGDRDQTIYGLASPFSRAGLDVRGRSHHLSLNHRNTLAVQELATEFMDLTQGFTSAAAGTAAATSGKNTPTADRGAWTDPWTEEGFREGPPPVLHRFAEEEAMEDALVSRLAFLTGLLGYDPENICILCPDNRSLEKLRTRIAHREGIAAQSVKDPDFDFTAPVTAGSEGRRAIRLSPFHSAKGLDFPVVLLWLPRLELAGSFDVQRLADQKRNLLYVGITRALDHVEAFVLEHAARDAVVAQLITAMSAVNKMNEPVGQVT